MVSSGRLGDDFNERIGVKCIPNQVSNWDLSLTNWSGGCDLDKTKLIHFGNMIFTWV